MFSIFFNVPSDIVTLVPAIKQLPPNPEELSWVAPVVPEVVPPTAPVVPPVVPSGPPWSDWPRSILAAFEASTSAAACSVATPSPNSSLMLPTVTPTSFVISPVSTSTVFPEGVVVVVVVSSKS